jgi:hypothetical protein
VRPGFFYSLNSEIILGLLLDVDEVAARALEALGKMKSMKAKEKVHSLEKRHRRL